jgi:signal peptidase I
VILLLSTSSTFNVEGDTMLPTLHSEQRVLVSRLLPSLQGIQRGDIVVFHAPTEPRDYVKRVIAVAGDEVRISADSDPEGDPGRVGDECGGCGVYVNGVLLHEKYVLFTPDYNYGPYTVPGGQIFVLGDNQRNSSDSHVWNALDVSKVTGKVIYSIWPNLREICPMQTSRRLARARTRALKRSRGMAGVHAMRVWTARWGAM